jgi:filamentous hemagglutinin family protein
MTRNLSVASITNSMRPGSIGFDIKRRDSEVVVFTEFQGKKICKRIIDIEKGLPKVSSDILGWLRKEGNLFLRNDNENILNQESFVNTNKQPTLKERRGSNISRNAS